MRITTRSEHAIFLQSMYKYYFVVSSDGVLFFQFPDDTAIFFVWSSAEQNTLCSTLYILPNIKSGVLC